jgi:hypothetical protein
MMAAVTVTCDHEPCSCCDRNHEPCSCRCDRDHKTCLGCMAAVTVTCDHEPCLGCADWFRFYLRYELELQWRIRLNFWRIRLNLELVSMTFGIYTCIHLRALLMHVHVHKCIDIRIHICIWTHIPVNSKRLSLCLYSVTYPKFIIKSYIYKYVLMYIHIHVNVEVRTYTNFEIYIGVPQCIKLHICIEVRTYTKYILTSVHIHVCIGIRTCTDNARMLWIQAYMTYLLTLTISFHGLY